VRLSVGSRGGPQAIIPGGMRVQGFDRMQNTDRGKADRELPLLWRLLEAYFHRVYGIRPLNEEPDCLIAYSRFRYRGPEVALQCGTRVRSGDPVLELHFRREALVPLARDGDPRRMGLALLRLAERDTPRLALALRDDPAFQDVKAMHALTLFHRGIT